MALTTFVTGEALTQARLGTLTTEITADIATEAAARAAADALKAPLASPVFTGHPVGVTESALDNSTRLSSTAYADAAVAAEVTARTAAIRAAIENRPAVADSWDEEFDTALGGFVNLNISNGASVSVVNGVAVINRPAADNADVQRGIVKTSPAASTWTVEAMITVAMPGASFQLLGLGARRGGGTPPNAANTTTDKLAYLGIGASAAAAALSIYGLKAVNSAAASTQIINVIRVTHPLFVRLAWDNVDTLTWRVSGDGIGWATALTLSATTVLGGAPDSVVMMMNAESATETTGCVHYVRRVA